jgi:hypothetical protein
MVVQEFAKKKEGFQGVFATSRGLVLSVFTFPTTVSLGLA